MGAKVYAELAVNTNVVSALTKALG